MFPCHTRLVGSWYVFAMGKSLFVRRLRMTLRKKCPYSKLFWSAFFPHFPAFGLNTERYSPRSPRPPLDAPLHRVLLNIQLFGLKMFFLMIFLQSIENVLSWGSHNLCIIILVLWYLNFGFKIFFYFIFLQSKENVFFGVHITCIH